MTGLEGLLFGFGKHILEIMVAHGLSNKLHHALQSLRPERNHDLEYAAAAAFSMAAKELARREPDGDVASVWKQLQKDADGLLPVGKSDFPLAVMEGLLTGDESSLNSALQPMTRGYFTGDGVEADAAGHVDRLCSTFLFEFGEVLKRDEHRKAYNAFLRETARMTLRAVKEEAQEVRGDLAKVMDRLESIESGHLEPDASGAFLRLGQTLLDEIDASRRQAREDAERGIATTRTVGGSILDRVEKGFEELRTILKTPEPAEPTPAKLSNLRTGSAHFIGRDDLLKEIEEALSKDSIVSLLGVGGIGKTEAALQYGNSRKKQFPYRLFVDAGSRERLQSGYATIARSLNLPNWGQSDKNGLARDVKTWMEDQSSGVLLIADNVERLQEIRDLLPLSGGCRVIVTRRPGTGSQGIVAIEVGELDETEGSVLLMRRAGQLEAGHLDALYSWDRTSAAEVCGLLGGNPLAIELAGAFMEREGWGPSMVANALKERVADLMRESGSTYDRIEDSVRLAAAESLRLASLGNGAVMSLLEFFSILAPTPIPEDAIVAFGPYLTEDLQGLVGDSARLSGALEAAEKLGLIERQPEPPAVCMHERVREAIRPRPISWREERLRMAIPGLGAAFPLPDPENWPLCDALLSHVRECDAWASVYGTADEGLARLLNRVAWYLLERGQLVEAKAFFERALAIFESADAEGTETAVVLGNLGRLYWSMRNYGDSILKFKRALEIRVKALGAEHPQAAASLHWIGTVYQDAGDHSEALSYFLRALAVQEKVLGETHADTDTTIWNLLLLYIAMEDFPQAVATGERLVAARTSAYGVDHPETASALHYLGFSYYRQGLPDEALNKLEAALDVRERVLNPESYETSSTLNLLGVILYERGDYEAALPYYRRSLSIREKVMGPGDPTTKVVRGNLENCESELSRT